MKTGLFAVADHYPGELPRTTARFYDELLEQVEAADAWGFDSFWVAEHHFHPYGAIPRPPVWMAAAAQRTRRIRLGAGGRVDDATVPFGLHVHCAPETGQARAEADEAMARYVRTRLYARQRPVDLLVDKDLVAFGTPGEIVRIARRYEALGLTHLLAIVNFGGLAHERVLASMELLAKHVLPAVAG